MSKQGKNAIVGKCEKCEGNLYMTHNGCCSTHYACFDCGHFYEVDEYAAAETAASDYAKQAAELQEEVERLRGILEHSKDLAEYIVDALGDEIIRIDKGSWTANKAEHILKALAETETNEFKRRVKAACGKGER